MTRIGDDRPHILIIDDEKNIRLVLRRALEKFKYEIDEAENGTIAVEKINAGTYHLILLDLNMQPISGIEVLNNLREKNQDTVVIILTAHSTIESAVEAIRLGAFDYLFKPVSPADLRQRVKEGLERYERNINGSHLVRQIDHIRRTIDEIDTRMIVPDAPPLKKNIIQSGEIEIDLNNRSVHLGDKPVDLTTTEYKLLICLINAAPNPVSPRHLAESVMGYDAEETGCKEIIKWHIHQLRHKIEPGEGKPVHIKTIRYEGYLWCG
jgi:DNA-binding response OmpR family regulator